jgi:hypothetical protein
VDDILGIREVAWVVDEVEALSGDSLSFTRVSICANLSRTDDTVACDK